GLAVGRVEHGVAAPAAAFARGVGPLLAARAVMGSAAAFIMPATLSILTNVFTDARERSAAIGVWAGVAGVGVAIGPVLGGFLLDHFWWGSVFFVNVPIVAVALVAGRLLVPDSRNPNRPRLDLAGAALSVVGLVSLVWAIIEAPRRGWTDPATLGAFAVAASSLAAFVVRELTAAQPMLDMRFFRNPRFTAASATIT